MTLLFLGVVTLLAGSFLVATVDAGTVNADFLTSSISGNEPHGVRFTDASSSGQEIVSWSWDFGDGSTSNLQNPSHVYTDDGSFTVSLNVTDADGSTHSRERAALVVVDNAAPLMGAPEMAIGGAAYLEQAGGLRVAQAGTNLSINPSAGIDTRGAAGVNLAIVERHSSGCYAGDTCFKVTTPGFGINEGIRFSQQDGAWMIPAVSQGSDQYQVTVAIRLLSTNGGRSDATLRLDDGSGGAAASDIRNLTLTEEWQTFSIGKKIDNPDLEFFIVPNDVEEGFAQTQFLVDVVTLEGERSHYEPIFGNGASDTIYQVPPYHGDAPGSTWTGQPHLAASSRDAGWTGLQASEFDIDFENSWWFALEGTLGFNDSDLFETVTKDFFNLGEPRGDGFGWTGNGAFVLDYNSTDRSFNLSRLGAASAAITSPGFKVGDRFRVIGAWDGDATRAHLWLLIGDGANEVIYAPGGDPATPYPFGANSEINLGYCEAWAGGYTSNSLLRNFVLEEGFPSNEQVVAYLENPSQPLLAGGYFYPLAEDLRGKKSPGPTPDFVAGAGRVVNINSSFSDPGRQDTHQASVDWGDGQVTTADVTQAGGSGAVSASHYYQANGLYSLTVTLADDDGGATTVDHLAEIDDPSAGRPELSLNASAAHWSSYADYTESRLTVDYAIDNKDTAYAYDVSVLGARNTSGVLLLADQPMFLGNITGGGSQLFELQFLIPSGVATFRSTVFCAAKDAQNVEYYFPGSLPGA